MKFETNYAIKLFFPSPAFIQIYLEAVANALDADANKIDITISTDGEIRNPRHLEIIISDNGVGFTPERFEKFKEIKEPNDPHHKGMGRLVYLKYFSTIEVESYYRGGKRLFTFTDSFDGESRETRDANDHPTGTKLTFRNFVGERIKSYDDLKPTSLKEQLLEHFLPQFLEMKSAKKEFRVSVNLQTESSNEQYEFFPDKVTLSQEDVPNFSSKTFKDDSIDVVSEIEILYLIRERTRQQENLFAMCIDGRTLRLPSQRFLQPTAIPPAYSVIFLFESDLFTGNSDSSRQKMTLPDTVSEPLLLRRLRKEVSQILNAEVPEIQERNTSIKHQLSEKYPHLTGYFEEDTVGLINRDEAIEMAQKQFFKSQKRILDSDSLDERTFKESLEISARTLTEYILYRELIIKRLKTMSENTKESCIHNLIVPRYKKFQDNDLVDEIYNNNAWLLDDKFMTFRTILSEARMDDILRAITLEENQEKDDNRPDIAMIFSADPSDSQSVDVVVIELLTRQLNSKRYAA